MSENLIHEILGFNHTKDTGIFDRLLRECLVH